MAKAKEIVTVVDGKRTDAHLHEPILAEGDHGHAEQSGRKAATRAGLTDAELHTLYSA